MHLNLHCTVYRTCVQFRSGSMHTILRYMYIIMILQAYCVHCAQYMIYFIHQPITCMSCIQVSLHILYKVQSVFAYTVHTVHEGVQINASSILPVITRAPFCCFCSLGFCADSLQRPIISMYFTKLLSKFLGFGKPIELGTNSGTLSQLSKIFLWLHKIKFFRFSLMHCACKQWKFVQSIILLIHSTIMYMISVLNQCLCFMYNMYSTWQPACNVLCSCEEKGFTHIKCHYDQQLCTGSIHLITTIPAALGCLDNHPDSATTQCTSCIRTL